MLWHQWIYNEPWHVIIVTLEILIYMNISPVLFLDQFPKCFFLIFSITHILKILSLQISPKLAWVLPLYFTTGGRVPLLHHFHLHRWRILVRDELKFTKPLVAKPGLESFSWRAFHYSINPSLSLSYLPALLFFCFIKTES